MNLRPPSWQSSVLSVPTELTGLWLFFFLSRLGIEELKRRGNQLRIFKSQCQLLHVKLQASKKGKLITIITSSGSSCVTSCTVEKEVMGLNAVVALNLHVPQLCLQSHKAFLVLILFLKSMSMSMIQSFSFAIHLLSYGQMYMPLT